LSRPIALLYDLIDGTSISITELSEKLFGDKNKNHLAETARSLSKNKKNLARKIFEILYRLDNLNDNDPNFRTEDLIKLKQEKPAVIYLYLTKKIYTGLSLELLETFYEEIFLKSTNQNEKLMYIEILNGINKRISDIDIMNTLDGNSLFDSYPHLDAHCIRLWGNTYRGLQTEMSQIKTRTTNNLRNELMNTKEFQITNGPPAQFIDYDRIRDEIIAIGDIKHSQGEVVDPSGNVISEYDMIYLLLGRQDSFGGTKPNVNLLHFLAGHYESTDNPESDFSKIGLRDPQEIAELIFDVVKNEKGLEVDDYRHRVVYKLEYHDRIEFLVLGIDPDKSIHTAFLADNDYKNELLRDFRILHTLDPYIV
jgi:hypothetical protein